MCRWPRVGMLPADDTGGAASVPRLTNLSDQLKWCECGTQMVLARIVPDVAGNERGTFECPTCEHVGEHVHRIEVRQGWRVAGGRDVRNLGTQGESRRAIAHDSIPSARAASPGTRVRRCNASGDTRRGKRTAHDSAGAMSTQTIVVTRAKGRSSCPAAPRVRSLPGNWRQAATPPPS